MSSLSAVLAVAIAEGTTAEEAVMTAVEETAATVVTTAGMTVAGTIAVTVVMTVLAAAKALVPRLRSPMTTRRATKRCSSLFTDIGEAA